MDINYGHGAWGARSCVNPGNIIRDKYKLWSKTKCTLLARDVNFVGIVMSEHVYQVNSDLIGFTRNRSATVLKSALSSRQSASSVAHVDLTKTSEEVC